MSLDEFLSKHDLNNTGFAQQIGVSSESVRRYRDRTRIPEKEVMAKIFEVTQGAVTANDFYDQAVAPAQAAE